jgi:hypothetical protein
LIDQAVMVWAFAGREYSAEELEHYVLTGSLQASTRPQKNVTPYNPMAMELIGKELDKRYG